MVATAESLVPEGYPASVLGKAHLLLEALASGNEALRLTELSRRSGVSKASAHRLAMELVALGLLTRTPAGYQLGWRIYELGRLVPGPARLRSVAAPVLIDLHSGLRAAVHLSVPHGADCVYLERFAGRRDVALLHAVNGRVPCHETVSGRIFLAHLGLGEVDSTDPAVLSAFDVATHGELRSALAEIREQRFAEEHEERLPGFKSMAVPVMFNNVVIAAISLTIPVKRSDDQQVLHALWAASGEIGRSLERGSARPSTRHMRVIP